MIGGKKGYLGMGEQKGALPLERRGLGEQIPPGHPRARQRGDPTKGHGSEGDKAGISRDWGFPGAPVSPDTGKFPIQRCRDGAEGWDWHPLRLKSPARWF